MTDAELRELVQDGINGLVRAGFVRILIDGAGRKGYTLTDAGWREVKTLIETDQRYGAIADELRALAAPPPPQVPQ